MRRLLLLSNSTNHGERYLGHAADEIVDLLASCRRVLFVPFALHDRAAYTAKFRSRLEELGRSVDELAADATGRRQIETAEAVFVGGGNTFRLLKTLQEAELLAPLGERALAGMPYLGASAGINLAGPTIRTTNDMPIVEPHGVRRPRARAVPDQSALSRRRSRFDPHGRNARRAHRRVPRGERRHRRRPARARLDPRRRCARLVGRRAWGVHLPARQRSGGALDRRRARRSPRLRDCGGVSARAPPRARRCDRSVRVRRPGHSARDGRAAKAAPYAGARPLHREPALRSLPPS